MSFFDILWILVCLGIVAVPEIISKRLKDSSAKGTRQASPGSEMKFPRPVAGIPGKPWLDPGKGPERPKPVVFPPLEHQAPVEKSLRERPAVISPVEESVENRMYNEVKAKMKPEVVILHEEKAEQHRKVSIDPKNLIVYSAIMEPKFKD